MKFRLSYFLHHTIITCIILSCVDENLIYINELPKALKEASGITYTCKNNLLWMVNDSNNEPTLFATDTLGKINRKIQINEKNIDWEDLTTDDNGNIFIGDFGNNANKRKNLRILKINNKDLGYNTALPEIISFYYPDQEKFPPKKKNRYYDCEAFLFLNNHLYLFTKSRNPKNSGLTSVYKIPAKIGHHKATYISSYNTCKEKGCWVTSVDINNRKDKLALLTNNSVYIFKNFKSDNFFKSEMTSYTFSNSSQKESITFKNDSTLYITDEKTKHDGGNLYKINID